MGTQKGLSRVTIVSMDRVIGFVSHHQLPPSCPTAGRQLLEEVRGKWKTWRRVVLEVTQNPGQHRVSLRFTSGAVKERQTGSILPWKCGLRQGQGPEV